MPVETEVDIHPGCPLPLGMFAHTDQFLEYNHRVQAASVYKTFQ